jgi:hypothetical protein|tara:strand:+ start:461 stop:655 length:195 start_codon:yes stop_codon:yes gene_type:complete
MSWMPSKKWYDELFDECNTKAEVVERAKEMIVSRDKRIEDSEERAVTMAQGNVATIETLLNLMY